MLPLAWWKLGFLWLFNVRSRMPPSRRTLVRGSFRTAIAGLALSVAAVSVSLALFAGFERVLATSVIHSLGHMTHFTKWHTRSELDAFVREAPEGVASATYFWTSQGLLVGPRGGRGVLIEGRSQSTVVNKEKAFTPGPPSGRVEVELGKPLAETLGVRQGETVRLLLPGVLRGSIEAHVRALVEYGMHDIDSRLAIVDDESLREYLAVHDPDQLAKRPGDAHGIRYVLQDKGRDPSQIDWVESWGSRYKAHVLESSLSEDRALFKTWQELQRNLFGSLGMDRKVVVTIMALLILVATLNVTATLVVLFLERDRELAILQAIGLSPRQLLSWIGIQGLIMGATASTLGLLLARLMAAIIPHLPLAQLPPDIYHVSTLPLFFRAAEQWGTFFFGIGAALVAALLLGLRLSRTPLLGVLGQRR